MPEISRFYGIIITMFVEEHNPPHLSDQTPLNPANRINNFME